MFDAGIIEILGPSAAVVLVVFLFIKFLRSTQESQNTLEAERLEAMKAINASCHAHSTHREEQLEAVLDRTTACLNRHAEITGSVLEALRRMNGKHTTNTSSRNQTS